MNISFCSMYLYNDKKLEQLEQIFRNRTYKEYFHFDKKLEQLEQVP